MNAFAVFTMTVNCCEPTAPRLSTAVIVSRYVPAGVVESAVIIREVGLNEIPCKLVGLIENVIEPVPPELESETEVCGIVIVV